MKYNSRKLTSLLTKDYWIDQQTLMINNLKKHAPPILLTFLGKNIFSNVTQFENDEELISRTLLGKVTELKALQFSNVENCIFFILLERLIVSSEVQL